MKKKSKDSYLNYNNRINSLNRVILLELENFFDINKKK